MKKALVSGYIGFDNFGDEAIFWALSTHLKSLGFDVSVICNNKSKVKKTYGVKAYNYKKINQILKAIINCDILISGGGSLLQNNTSNHSLYYYLFIIFLAKLFFKKVIIFAQGFEPINGKFNELITKLIVKKADLISVRDENSQKLLKDWKINSILTSDPAYSIVDNVKINKHKTGLIVQLRNFQNINPELVKDLALAVSKNYIGKINVFSFQDKIDTSVCIDFIVELKKLNVYAELIVNKTINETIDILNSAQFVISTRLHGLITANALNCNCFALDYDNKIKSLCRELELQNIDLFNYSQSELDKKLSEFFKTGYNSPHPYRKFNWDCIDAALEK